MCGICGMFRSQGLPLWAGEKIREMSSRLRHRGPDDEGFLLQGEIGLGSRRLSIVDLEGGRQPIASEDGAVQVVYNGEIYNHEDLRRGLEEAGHRFATRTDTEVIAHLYEERGLDGLQDLNGIFALALWDATRRRLLLARDPLGVKPLYYAHVEGGLAFASEAKALLLLPGLPRRVDEEALHLYLSFRFVPSPWTMFQGIRKLAPGERLVVESGGAPRIERYAPPPPAVDPVPREAEWAEALTDELQAAVRRQLMGDVPVGVLLSGGVDSAAILAAAAAAGSRPLRAFTVGFPSEPELDESAAAAATASAFGVEHRAVDLTEDGYRRRFAPSMFHMDEPVATPSVAPYQALCELAASDVKVVLSGQGADEPFGGYRRHLAEAVAGGAQRPWLSGPPPVAPSLRPASEPPSRDARTLAARRTNERYATTLALFTPAEIGELRDGGSGDPDPIEVVRRRAAPADHLDDLGRFLYLDSRFGLADDLLLYGDKISMACSLEVRVPFLDLELLRFVERIPASLRIRRLRPKHLLRRALERMLPPEILARPKRNFSPPDRAWLEGPAEGPGTDWLLEPDAAVSRYLRADAVARLVREQREGRRDRRRQIFALLAFEAWHRIFIDRTLAVEEQPLPAAARRGVPGIA